MISPSAIHGAKGNPSMPKRNPPMQIEVQKVTAAQAMKWLENTIGKAEQRNLSRLRVERFAKIMADGEWLPTHQAIAISPDGKIIDGQHRLAAIALFGGDVELAVATNADPSTFVVIDVGKPRTTSDILKIAGVTDYAVVAAAVRNLIAYDRVVGTTERLTRAKQGVTAQAILDFVQSPRGEALIDLLPRARRIAHGLGNPSTPNSLVASLAIINEAMPLPLTYNEFVERLTDGAMLPAGSPLLALRRWFTSEAGWFSIATNAKAEFSIALTLKAWNAYVTGQSRQVMVFKGSEPMPHALAGPTLPTDEG